MKVALTVWGDRISPLFDSTRMLLVADIERRGITKRFLESLDCESAFSRATKLVALDVNILICNGISGFLSQLIEAYGIQVIPFTTGGVDEILEAFVTGKLSNRKSQLQGCGSGNDRVVGREK